jgi:hypothetical protein
VGYVNSESACWQWINVLIKIEYNVDLDFYCFSFPNPTKWGGSVQQVFYHVLIKIRQLCLLPAACVKSTFIETGVGDNDCKCSRDQRLNVPILPCQS